MAENRGRSNKPERPSNDAPALVPEAHADETINDHTKWKLPKAAKARLGKGGINVLQFSPDGKKLVSGTMEGNIQMWDTETGIGLFSFTNQDPDNVQYGVKEAANADIDTTVVI